jgi:hypothetical protein
MSTQVQKSEYQILDHADEEQIKNAQNAVKQALCYEITIKGKKVRQITFVGLKWLTLQMSQKGQALEIQDSEVKLEKDGVKESLWFWRAKVKVRNQKTGLETEGISECPYSETLKDGKTKYDPFGRTKAHSKAERNAWRKQIPELEITTLLESVAESDTDKISNQQNTETRTEVCKCPYDVMQNDGGKCGECGLALTINQINMLAQRNT